MKKKIDLGVHGIVVSLDGSGGGQISSWLKAGCGDGDAEDDKYLAAVDGIESLVLAHACAGVDVKEPAYLKGVNTAVDAILNNT